ncbi:MAG TPA: hypothetical protein VJK54_00950 [Chthoniobacterales bacterium]|nr:hypothetical protein [Chthoniobacterales bacterium]
MKKLIISLSLITIALIFMPGCNTISGAGHDVSDIGSGVAAGANSVSRSMRY